MKIVPDQEGVSSVSVVLRHQTEMNPFLCWEAGRRKLQIRFGQINILTLSSEDKVLTNQINILFVFFLKINKKNSHSQNEWTSPKLSNELRTTQTMIQFREFKSRTLFARMLGIQALSQQTLCCCKASLGFLNILQKPDTVPG